MVAILVVLALNLSGVLTMEDALAGFGQPVMVLIAAVSIVGEGLIATGVAHRLGEAVMKIGGTNGARLTEILPAVGVVLTSPARLCRPRRQLSRAHPRETRGSRPAAARFVRDTDCPLEGGGFEPSVPRRRPSPRWPLNLLQVNFPGVVYSA